MSIQVGQSYNFKVVRSENNYSILEDPFGTSHYYNKYLTLNQEICLFVYNEDEGKYHFKEIVEFGNYQVGNVYDFIFERVEEKIHDINRKYTVYVVKDEKNNEHEVLPFYWQNHPDYIPPDKLTCRITSIKCNSLNLLQRTTPSLLHPFFKLNESYEFDFIDIVQEINREGRSLPKIKLKGIDDLEYSTYLLYGQRYEDLKNKKIKCRFTGYYPHGELKLIQTEKPIMSFDVVTESCPYEDIKSFKEKAFNSLKNSDDPLVLRMFKDYEKGENIWVFSYCELIQSKIFQLINEFNYSDAIFFINILISVEEWILKSGFLNSFNPEKREINRLTAKGKIKNFTDLIPALKYLMDIGAEDYLNAIVRGEITISEQSLATAFNIIDHSNRAILSNHTIFEYLKHCGQMGYYSSSNWQQILQVLAERKKDLRKEVYKETSFDLNSSLIPEYDKKKNWEIIELTIIEILVHRDLNDPLLEAKSLIILLKQLAYYVSDEEKKNDLIKKSLMVFSFPKFTSVIADFLNWKNLILEEIIDKIINVHLTTIEFEEIKSEITEKYFRSSCLDVTIKVCTKNGYLVSFRGLTGFVPKQHLYKTLWSKLKLGTELKINILLLNKESLNFIGTGLIYDFDSINKKYSEDIWQLLYLPPRDLYDIENYKKNKLKTFSVGQIISGKVKAFEEYGAFINLGEIDGLLHISDIAWKVIKHPSEVLHLGQEIECLVKEIDENKNTISLSLKSLNSEPWELLDKSLIKGSNIEVKVVNKVDYGFFVELDCGVQGLLHKSNISSSKFDEQDQYNIGDILRVEIDNIDRDKRKMSVKKPDLIVNNSASLKTDSEDINDEIPEIDYDSQLFYSMIADVGYCYEYKAFLNKKLTDMIEMLNWAHYYYYLSGAKKLYLSKYYIKYFKVIQKFESAENVQELQKMSTSYYYQVENDLKTVSVFPSLKKLANYLRVLSLFNTNSTDGYKFLSEIAINEKSLYQSDEVRLAKLILSNNLLISEQYDEDFISKNRNVILRYLREGVFQIQESIIEEPDENEIIKHQKESELRNLILKGESEKLEFKSTFRVCLNKKFPPKFIEYQSFKAITAFLNSGGGNLIIGVGDDKNIIGLKKDFATFSPENKIDEFRKHFDNLIERFLGNQFSNYIELNFIEVDDDMVCRVNIKGKTKEPVFLKYEDKDEFWIRRTGSNKQLGIKEATIYIKDNW